jgi:hypothetical protein
VANSIDPMFHVKTNVLQKIVLLVLMAFPLSTGAQSQSAPDNPSTLNIGGGSEALNSNFVVDWSIGESTLIETYYGQNPFANSIVGIDWYITSGVLQPYDKTHIIYNPLVPNWTNEEIRFYPVPTHDIVFIDFRSVTTGKISIQLFSVENKFLGLKEYDHVNGSGIQKWDLTNKANGIYYFQIILSASNGDILKRGTFKVEKL